MNLKRARKPADSDATFHCTLKILYQLHPKRTINALLSATELIFQNI